MSFKISLYHSAIFTYEYLAGPVSTPEELEQSHIVGNCRTAIQWYYYRIHNIFLQPDLVLPPMAYTDIGRFLDGNEPLRDGDIVYAQNDQPKTQFTADDWMIKLHTAIIIQETFDSVAKLLNLKHIRLFEDYSVLHATPRTGGLCLWTLDEFEKLYKTIAIKRII